MRLGQQASIVIQRSKQAFVARAPATGRQATGRTAKEAVRRLDRSHGALRIPDRMGGMLTA